MAVITINLNLDTDDVPEGATNLYFTQPRVRATPLTGLNVTGGSIAATDTIIVAMGKIQNQINGVLGGAIYQGTWNAITNSPTLVSSTGTKGYYYVVSVAGSTNLDGVTDWKVGDWAIFNGTVWEKVDNTDAVSSVNGYIGAVNLVTDDIAEGASNLYFEDQRAIDAVAGQLDTTDTVILSYSAGTFKADAKYQFSVDADASGLKLVNDEEEPGNYQYYGTGFNANTKGWHTFPTIEGIANRIDVNYENYPTITVNIHTSYAGQTSITTLGTITTGVWSGTTIAANKGGTGQTVYAIGDILYADTTTSLAKLAAVAAGSMIISNGVTTAPSWSTAGRLTSLSLNTAALTTVSPLMIMPMSNLRDGGWNTTIEIQSTVSNPFPALIFGNQTGNTRYSSLSWTRSTSGNTSTSQQANFSVYESGNVGVIEFRVNGNIGTTGITANTFVITGNQRVGIGVAPASILSKLHIAAGSATANTAPLQFTSGTVETTARGGVMEYNNTFHLTNSDNTRRHVATAPNTTKVIAGAPYANDGYIVINIGGTDFKVMTTA